MSRLAAFLFGKLPSHGDFVARGLAPAARQAWDDWASAGLVLARERLGPAFEAAHDAAPPWRFAFGAAPYGRRLAGALAASVDSAGRRYLIVVGAQADAGLAGAGAGALAAARLEAALYRAFEAGLDADALLAQAQDAVAGLEPGPPAQDGRFWTLGAGEGQAQDIAAAAPPRELVLRMLGGGGAAPA